jgi:hypothetical protein
VDAGGVNPAFDTTGRYDRTSVSETNWGDYVILADAFSPSVNSQVTDLLVPLSKFAATGTFSNAPPMDFYIVPDASGTPDSDPAGNPEGILYSGAASNLTSVTPTIFDVSMSGSATLTAGTTYWLLAKVPGLAPQHVACPQGNSTCLWYDDAWSTYAESTVQSYESNAYASGWSGVSNFVPAFTLENGTAGTGAATPEPASFLLAGCGLMGLSLAMRILFPRN